WKKIMLVDYAARRARPLLPRQPRIIDHDTASGPPLVVDLDGTLLKSDTLIETFVSLLGSRPLRALLALAELRHGRAAFKARLGREAALDVARLPWNEAVLDLVRAARAEGRRVYLASASDRTLVEAMTGHLGLFDGAFASDGVVNLSGPAKCR